MTRATGAYSTRRSRRNVRCHRSPSRFRFSTACSLDRSAWSPPEGDTRFAVFSERCALPPPSDCFSAGGASGRSPSRPPRTRTQSSALHSALRIPHSAFTTTSMPRPTVKKAPGPAALPATGHLYRFRRDVLGMLLRSVRDYGDVVRFRLVHKVFHLVNHPDYAEHVLHRNAANYDKETPSSDKIRDVCGDSLLTLNGEPWKRRRRLMQPAFVQDELAGFVPVMTGATAAMLERWAARRAGEAFDLSADMMALAF